MESAYFDLKYVLFRELIAVMETKVYLSKNLHFLLKKNYVSQNRVCTASQISKATFNNYLHGVTPQGIATILAIAEFFKIKPEELLFSDLQNNVINNTIENKELVTAPTEQRFEITIKKI